MRYAMGQFARSSLLSVDVVTFAGNAIAEFLNRLRAFRTDSNNPAAQDWDGNPFIRLDESLIGRGIVSYISDIALLSLAMGGRLAA